MYYSKTDGFAIGAASGVSKRTINSGVTTSQGFTGLSANTAYYFKVVAKGTGAYSDSDASAQKTATTKTKLRTPTVTAPRDITSSAVRINWNRVSNASGYQVHYSRTSGVTRGITQVTVSSGSTTSQRITGLTANTTYYFKVVATGSGRYINTLPALKKQPPPLRQNWARPVP